MLSIFLHAIGGGLYFTARKLGWQGPKVPAFIDRLFAPAPPKVIQQAIVQAQQKREEARLQEIPLTFVEVDPSKSAKEPPKDAKYYSTASTIAANPDATKDLNQPKLEGRQSQVAKTMDVPKAQPKPLPQPQQTPSPKTSDVNEQKTPNPDPKSSTAKSAEARPKGGLASGDLAMAKPVATPLPLDGSALNSKGSETTESRPRPRSLAEAKARQAAIAPPEPQITGEKMLQEGGVKRFDISSSLDVKATPFAAYDAEIIAAIQSQWYALLEARDFARDRTGKVVVEFRLHFDGRVTDMKTSEQNVGDYLDLICQRAVMNPAPYRKWPSDMRRLNGKDFRDVRFTFYYN